MWRLLIIFNFSCFIFNCTTYGRQPIGIAYYDVDRLYDTVPALFYDDSDYTPEGRLRWTPERYTRKIRNTAAVIDSMALPIVALWGVENEQVVRDLAAACQGDYSYLHRTLNSLDGMDFALLYYGDLFYPTYDESGRGYLYVEGELGRDTVGLVLCSDPRTARWLIGDLREERPHAKLLVMGRNVRSARKWRMRDRIWADTALQTSEGDVFARRYLVAQKTGNPLTTYSRGVYRGGYGYSLPVFVYIR